MRRPEHDRIHGNHVSSWVVPLPLGLDDPIEQLERIEEITTDLKENDAALAVDSVMEMAEWIPGPVLERALGAIGNTAPVNMIVTNVPGPQIPLYLAGAKLLAMYPIVPLIPGGGLGVALFSYEGKLCWGFNGDYELVPDLGMFVEDVAHAFEGLRRAAVARFMARRTAPSEVAPDGSEASSPGVEASPETAHLAGVEAAGSAGPPAEPGASVSDDLPGGGAPGLSAECPAEPELDAATAAAAPAEAHDAGDAPSWAPNDEDAAGIASEAAVAR
jgi:hypothetical protein